MICSHCNFDNPADANECQNCGRPLKVICPNCGTANDPVAKFCMNCATSLTGAPTPTTQPDQKTKSAKLSTGERRVVTILFSDVKGSTALAEQLDPEEWADIMSGTFRLLIEAVNRYEGNVARLMGDAILAFFGAPTAHEDDPLRAIRAGLDILSDLRPYQERIRHRLQEAGLQAKDTDFEVRVGINTGLVVVGDIGTTILSEYTAMGDAINLASRMEQTAQPGTVQIGADTYKLVAPFVEVESLGQIEVKGKRESVATYRVLGLKDKPDRVRSGEGISSPLIGRDGEVAQLLGVLDNLDRGSGSIVSLIGEAGLGKSRLIRELSKISRRSIAAHKKTAELRLESAPAPQWHEIVSPSFESRQPYGAIRRATSLMLSIEENEAPSIVRQRISQISEKLPAAERPAFERSLQSLLILGEEEEDSIAHGQAFQRELYQAMDALWRYQSAEGPVTLIFDDIHWADAASVELIGQLLGLAKNLPLLIVCSLRPEQESPAWALKQLAESDHPQAYLEINIRPLSVVESHTLVGNLLNVPTLPEQAALIIWQKSQGIPLFIEELARELLASGVVIQGAGGSSSQFAKNIDDINIPESVEALLLARIDRLDEPTRRTVQLAAVIGKTFDSPVLRMISENGDQLDQQLLKLQAMGVIELAEQPGEQAAEQVYMFRHALTQEAAYNTMLLKERRRIHGRIGQVMKRLYPEKQEEYAPRLAYHFDQAGDHSQAINYYSMAAQGAARYYANREAVAHYTSAIKVAQETHMKDPALVELYRGRGLVQETLGEFENARADLETALELAQLAGDAHTEWRCLLDLGKLWSSRDYDQTGEYFRKALELAREMDDPAALARSLNRMGNWYVNSVQPDEGIRLHREALALFEWMDDKPGLAATLDLLGMACQIGGDIVVGANYYKQAIALFRELDDRPGLAASLATLGVSGMNFDTQTLVPAADLTESLYFNNEGLQLAREIGWRAGESFALWIRGEAYGVLGDFDKALSSAKEALQIAVEIDHHQWMAGSHTGLGHIFLELLAPDIARDHLEQALDLARQVRSGYFTHLATGSLAKSFIRLGQLDKAETCLDALIPLDAPINTIGQRHCWLVRAQLLLAKDKPAEALMIVDDLINSAANLSPGVVISSLWKARGDSLMALGRTKEAEAVLQAAAENARESRERTMLWPIQQSLCRLYLATDRPQLADREFIAAQSVIDALSNTIPEQSLKENFRQKASFFENP